MAIKKKKNKIYTYQLFLTQYNVYSIILLFHSLVLLLNVYLTNSKDYTILKNIIIMISAYLFTTICGLEFPYCL